MSNTVKRFDPSNQFECLT